LWAALQEKYRPASQWGRSHRFFERPEQAFTPIASTPQKNQRVNFRALRANARKSMIAKKNQPLLFFLKTLLGPPAGCMRPLFLLLLRKTFHSATANV
jgi:hypothetical protein